MMTTVKVLTRVGIGLFLVHVLTIQGIARPAVADDVKNGVVIRGLTIPPSDQVPPPRRISGQSTTFMCDFSGEDLVQNNLEDASVNCKPNGDLSSTLKWLPARFNAYCLVNAPVKSARLIQAPVKDNANHCSLSGITPADATSQFGGSVWR